MAQWQYRNENNKELLKKKCLRHTKISVLAYHINLFVVISCRNSMLLPVPTCPLHRPWWYSPTVGQSSWSTTMTKVHLIHIQLVDTHWCCFLRLKQSSKSGHMSCCDFYVYFTKLFTRFCLAQHKTRRVQSYWCGGHFYTVWPSGSGLSFQH